MNQDRWCALMRALNIDESAETYGALESAYSEKHRHYHTQTHIDDCLTKFDLVKNLAKEIHEIELAIWFHDAIYKPLSSDNERRSADWARSFLLKNGATEERAQRVHRLIMATLHTAAADDADTALLIDIDLSILGESANVYDEFEKSVRKEYALVPEFLFRKKRIEILQTFLDRDRIYANGFFYRRYEQSARANINSAIAKLAGDAAAT
ncbi:MAG: hypothetical protein HY308_10435 [Gammaproteobacteria bacterium]|nr:hypothetical protein [Gammaproteobacteria bacterium]